MSNDAMDRAASKLARILEGIRVGIDNASLHAIARGEEKDRVMGLLLYEARTLLREMGLVAVDPALVDAVRAHLDCSLSCEVEQCDRCCARRDLADAVLAALSPPP